MSLLKLGCLLLGNDDDDDDDDDVREATVV